MSLGAGLIVLVIATSIGLLLGVVSGYFGGKIDTLIQRITDVFLTVPGLILAMAVSAALGPSLVNVMWAISLVWWPGYCRLTRAEVLRRKEEAYIEAARSIGAHTRTASSAKHILPNIFTPVLVKASMDIGFAVLTLASLGLHRPRRAAVQSRLGQDDRRWPALPAGVLLADRLFPASRSS